jgi:hypothetical protein
VLKTTPADSSPVAAALEQGRTNHQPKNKENHKGDDKDEKEHLGDPGSAAEIPVKPNRPAIIETIKKDSASLSTASLAACCLSGPKPDPP